MDLTSRTHDIRSWSNSEAEAELVDILTHEIMLEIDSEIIEILRNENQIDFVQIDRLYSTQLGLFRPLEYPKNIWLSEGF